MTKLKRARTLMAIILIPVCGWVAVVGLVIKPPFWLGAILSIIGGIVIGAVVAYLIRRWWFKGRLAPIYEKQTHKKRKYEMGTRLVKPSGTYRYAYTEEDLKKGTIVEAGLSGRLVIGEPLPGGKELNELIYGDVRPARQVDKHGTRILGWPIVDVKKARHFWLQEPPPGAEFEKEGKR